jgi:uncharacterized protein
VHEKSLYLRQHAHNPVMWLPYGEAAIKLAREQNKPILLSIGYSSCYWCHVMERDVFENVSIASYMNEHFINIKIDREEWPDVDMLYMVARQLLTQEGGWPNNVFLTPDLKPFYAGGTFAADHRYNKPSFKEILEWLHSEWTHKREDVEKRSHEIFNIMQALTAKSAENKAMHAGAPAALLERLAAHHDERSGGFYRAPKFPHESYLLFLLEFAHATGDVKAMNMAGFSLAKMASGGIYDHVAGGFHRYSVDKEWYVPHFEKMLYNQALLAKAYTEHFRLKGDGLSEATAHGVLDFVAGVMTAPNGLFYSAIDAESDGVEGAYYAWTKEEISSILTPEQVEFFLHYYALADIPHFAGHKAPTGQVIVARVPLHEMAKREKLPFIQLAALSGQVMNTLLMVRNLRPAPALDTKAIASWNGLMISAFAKASTVLKSEKLRTVAIKAGEAALQHFRAPDGSLRRVFVEGELRLSATLEDYAFLIEGFIALHRTTQETRWLKAAEELYFEAERELKQEGGDAFTSSGFSPLLPIRMVKADDDALPSPQAQMAHNAIDLFDITKAPLWLDRAERIISTFADIRDANLLPEHAHLMHAQLRYQMIRGAAPAESLADMEDIVSVQASMARHGITADIILSVSIAEGWALAPYSLSTHNSIPTTLEIKGAGLAQVLSLTYPTANTYSGAIEIHAKVQFKAGMEDVPLTLLLAYQPCSEGICQRATHKVVTLS